MPTFVLTPVIFSAICFIAVLKRQPKRMFRFGLIATAAPSAPWLLLFLASLFSGDAVGAPWALLAFFMSVVPSCLVNAVILFLWWVMRGKRS